MVLGRVDDDTQDTSDNSKRVTPLAIYLLSLCSSYSDTQTTHILCEHGLALNKYNPPEPGQPTLSDHDSSSEESGASKLPVGMSSREKKKATRPGDSLNIVFEPYTCYFFWLFKEKKSASAAKWLRLFTYQMD